MKCNRKRINDIYIILMVLALTLTVVWMPAAPCPNWQASAVYAEDAEDEQLYLIGYADYDKAYDVLDRLNSERSKRGLATLSMDQTLMEAAMTRAAETVLYFEHARPNGGVWNSVSPKVNGENLGKGTDSSSRIMSLWMNSPTHRENVLRSNFRSVGVACFQCRGGTYWVQLFGAGGSEGANRPENGTISVGIDLPEGGRFTPELEITEAIESKPLADAAGEAESAEGDGEEKPALRMFEGERLSLGLKGDGLTFDPSKLSWTVSDPEIGNVDEIGVLRITGSGELTVTAATGSIPRASIKIATKKHIGNTYILDSFSGTEEVTERKYLEVPVCPKLTLLDEGSLLKEGSNYTINYRNNEISGTGEIEIRGMGDYGGIVTKTFEIQ